MIRRRSNRLRGSALLEFTLVGLPLFFLLMSVFEMARGMWLDQTLAFAVKAGTRYTSVHGSNCAIAPNTCTVTLGQIAGAIQSAGPGLDAGRMQLTFQPAGGSSTACLLRDCLADTTTWPPPPYNTPGSLIVISATYPFTSAIAMFWPGTSPHGSYFTVVNFPASSKERIQF